MKFISRNIILIIISVITYCSANIQWGGDNYKSIIKVDGKGYYSYLPAVFIYHDLNFTYYDSIKSKYYKPYNDDFRVEINGKMADKYFVGTAIAMSPFFLFAHSLALVCNAEPDGYSQYYCISISIAAIFYLFLGLFYLKKLLRLFGASDNQISFILIAITFGTNLFYYTVGEPSMSHVYSFGFITLFVYYLKTFFDKAKVKHLFILSVLLAIITLIRPANFLILLIAPFIAGDKITFLNGFSFLRKHLSAGIAGALLFMLIVFIQLIIYKIQTGNFWINSYVDEKFNWLNPHPIAFLFSFKKGLFVYTPIALLSLVGFYKLLKQSKFQFYSLSVFLIVLLYVVSSWWNWWYGGSFSSRVCVEYYSVMALLIYFAFESMKKKIIRIIYSSLIILMIIICQIQTYQYRYYFIHWEDMTKESYWKVFMRVDLLASGENPNADLIK